MQDITKLNNHNLTKHYFNHTQRKKQNTKERDKHLYQGSKNCLGEMTLLPSIKTIQMVIVYMWTVKTEKHTFKNIFCTCWCLPGSKNLPHVTHLKHCWCQWWPLLTFPSAIRQKYNIHTCIHVGYTMTGLILHKSKKFINQGCNLRI